MAKPDLKVLTFPTPDKISFLPKDKRILMEMIKKEYNVNNLIIIFDYNDGVYMASSFKDTHASRLRVQNLLCEAIMSNSAEGFEV